MTDVEMRRRWFADSVRARRRALHLSQEQVAQRSGLDRKTVNRVEQAVQNLSMDRMWRLAEALDLDVRDLLSPGRPVVDPIPQLGGSTMPVSPIRHLQTL
jgi:transcriptional regulator with XRE-family HTH domain